ncbi:MAG TPA: hypothetical protein VKU82_11295 [Planctomycetaceae bacterium]|nr:hypothetical protein [Planctomycetaceae bacterium]
MTKLSFARLCMTAVAASVALGGANLIGGENKSLDPADETALRAIAEGWLANRESFKSFTCRFVWRGGKAASAEHAFRGEIDYETTHNCVWIVDGDNVRYDMTSDPATTRQSHAEFYLKFGRIRARQSPESRSVELFVPDHDDEVGVSVTPFGMSMMGPHDKGNPAAMIEGILGGTLGNGKLAITIDGDDDVRGTPAVRFSIRLNEGGDVLKQFSLDPQRGFLPLRCLYFHLQPKKAVSLFTVKFRDCGDGRWFPMRSLLFIGPTSDDTPVVLQEVHVNELSLETPPAENFALDLAAGTRVSFRDDQYYSVTIADDEHVAGEQLHALLSRVIEQGDPQKKFAAEVAARKKLIAPVDATAGRVRFWWTVGTGIVIAATLLGGGVRSWRAKPRR